MDGARVCVETQLSRCDVNQKEEDNASGPDPYRKTSPRTNTALHTSSPPGPRGSQAWLHDGVCLERPILLRFFPVAHPRLRRSSELVHHEASVA